MSFSSERERPGGSENKTKPKGKAGEEEVERRPAEPPDQTDEVNRLGLTDDVELDDLLGVEGADADGADVGAVVSNLQPAQGQRGVALGHHLRGVHAGACSSFTCWRREAALREASGLVLMTVDCTESS